MDRTRKILVALMSLLAFSIILAIIDINMTMQRRQRVPFASISRTGDGIGIVRVEGPIEMIRSQGPLGSATGAEAIINRLDEFYRSDSIKAVVLRINSPGGTVGATQEIYQKLWKLRKKNIVLVASMGEMAASGGYYVAAACNKIVANQGTLTGSIGVIILSPNLRKLFEKLGITMNVIKSGAYKDILSSYRDMTQSEREIIQQMIDSSYNQFIKDIARGRNMLQSKILPFADGRIMSGEAAKKAELIDEVGTFEDAIDLARKLSELPDDSPIYEDIKTPFQQLLLTIEGMYQGGSAVEKHFNLNNYHIVQYRYLP